MTRKLEVEGKGVSLFGWSGALRLDNGTCAVVECMLALWHGLILCGLWLWNDETAMTCYALSRIISILHLIKTKSSRTSVPMSLPLVMAAVTRIFDITLYGLIYYEYQNYSKFNINNESNINIENNNTNIKSFLYIICVLGSSMEMISGISGMLFHIQQSRSKYPIVIDMKNHVKLGIDNFEQQKAVSRKIYIHGWLSSFLLVFRLYILGYIYSTSEFNGTTAIGAFLNSRIPAALYIFYGMTQSTAHIYSFHPTLRAGMTSFLLTAHILGIFGLERVLREPSLPLVRDVFLLYLLGGLGITCGNHRLWAHRAYSACIGYRFVLFLMSSLANQGCIYHWSRDHRVHHKYSDTEKDPHNASRGFFYSHMGWLLEKKGSAVKEAGTNIDCSDLANDNIIHFQRVLDPWWNQFICFLVPALYSYYIYGQFWKGLLVLGFFRWLILLHATWTVNSLAHLYGQRPYNPYVYPCESLLTSLLAVGEGWHNWHHLYPFDYAASEGGALKVWNPSKVFIDTAAFLGLVWNRKRAVILWEKAKERLRRGELSAFERKTALARQLCGKVPCFGDCLRDLVKSLSNWWGVKQVVRDVLLCSVIAIIAVVVQLYILNPFKNEWWFYVLSSALWAVYSATQGTVAFGLWVLGYECSMRRFGQSELLGDVVGFILHSLLLIPYRVKPRNEIYQAKKICLLQAFRADSWAILKLPFLATWNVEHYAVLAAAAAMAFVAHIVGPFYWTYWYAGAYVCLNLWLHVYHWLILNEAPRGALASHAQSQEASALDSPQGPCAADKPLLNQEDEILEYFTPAWLQNVWPRITQTHGYPWSKLMGVLHHNLALAYVVQAVHAQVPLYHVTEAWQLLGQLLDNFDSDITDAKLLLLKNFKNNFYDTPEKVHTS